MAGLNIYLKSFFAVVLGFCRITGMRFVAACAALAISRVCQMVAFFLPLKIFIVIHSEEIPEYFNIFPEGMSFRDVVLLLSALIPVIYGLFFSFGIAYRWLVDRHLQQFVNAELSIEGVNLPRGKVKPLHNHISRAFSEVGLIAVSVMFALFLDVMIAVAWVMLLYLNLWLFYRKAFLAEDHHRLTFLKLHRGQFIDYVSSANFLVIFAVLAIELVYFDMGVYSAIFLLLVSRMVFQALNRFSVQSLYILKLLP